MLVRNTGRRVPNVTGDNASLPPRSASAAENAMTSGPAPSSTSTKARSGRTNGVVAAAPAANATSRVHDSTDARERTERANHERLRNSTSAAQSGAGGGALDKLARSEASDAGAVAAAAAAAQTRGGVPRPLRERSDDTMNRTGGSIVHPTPTNGPPRVTPDGTLLRENDSMQNLHHSTHGRSAASQAVNTASTIDSMLAAGRQDAAPEPSAKEPAPAGAAGAEGSSSGAAAGTGGAGAGAGGAGTGQADEDFAHAQAIANLGLPTDTVRRHQEVRVYDIKTDGPPRGIPEDWENGLLEGRQRPPTSAIAVTSAPAGTAVASASAAQNVRSFEEGSGQSAASHGASSREEAVGAGADASRTSNARLQAAQHAAEQSVELAKKRAARAKMVRLPFCARVIARNARALRVWWRAACQDACLAVHSSVQMLWHSHCMLRPPCTHADIPKSHACSAPTSCAFTSGTQVAAAGRHAAAH